MRLGPDTLAHLPADVGIYSYDRDAQKIGIVHFGIGAFHRAHQAWYTDCAMAAGDRDWGICGVSLRSPDVARQLVAIAERSRNLGGHGLAEGASTRMLVHTGRLVAQGLPLGQAVDTAIVMPVTDEPDVRAALTAAVQACLPQ